MKNLFRRLTASAEDIEEERLRQEVERIRRKAIENDPKGGKVTGGTVVGDRVLLSEKERPDLDEQGLAFDPNATTRFIVEQDTTPEDDEKLDRLITDTRQEEELLAEFEQQLEEPGQVFSIDRAELSHSTDPWADVLGKSRR